MKQLLTILCVLGAFLAKAQDQQKQETKEERQQRYIEEVNPFRELGYKPRISTLSKGKYREAFPDSIVQIGNFTYNILEKRITGVRLFEEFGISEATAKPEIVSRWMSPDPLSDEFPDVSPYNFVNNNPIRFVDPDGRAPVDWIKNNLTGAFEWRNDVTSVANTPKNYTYVGKTDNSIVTNLFGNSSFQTSDWDAGLISVEDFDNPYSAKGAAFFNMSANTTMSVGLRADVTTKFNDDGSIATKEFNGIGVGVAVSGEVNAPYPGVDIKLSGRSMTLGGDAISVHTPSPNGEFIQGGDVPTLTYDGFLSSKAIQNAFRASTNLDVTFKGQYSNNGFPMSSIGAAGLLGVPNSTNLNSTLPLNNTANPYIIDDTNN